MLIQIIQHRIEFIYQILLACLVYRIQSGGLLHGDTISDIIYKKGQKVGINHHFPQAVIAEIVPAELSNERRFFLINGAAGALVVQDGNIPGFPPAG